MPKHTLVFKTPDVFDIIPGSSFDEDRQQFIEFVEQYIKWGEMISIEFDSDKKKVTVQKC